MSGSKVDTALGLAVAAFAAFFIWKFWSNEQKTEQFLSDIGTAVGTTIHDTAQGVSNTAGDVWRPISCLLDNSQPMCNLNPNLVVPQSGSLDYNPIAEPIPLTGGQAIIGSAPWYHPEATPVPVNTNQDAGYAEALAGLMPAKPVDTTFIGIVDTGEVTPMGSHIMTDTSTGGMVLRTGIVDIVGSLAPKVNSCEQRGGYYSFSNGHCYGTLAEYCDKYPGADMCRGL